MIKKIFALFLMFCVAATVSAELVAYESFDYAAGSGLNGKVPDYGFAAWSDADAHSITLGMGYQDVNGNQLVSAGNKVSLVGSGQSSFAALSAGSLGAANQTIWLSVIGYNPSVDAEEWGGLSLMDNSNERLYIGVRWLGTNWSFDNKDGGRVDTSYVSTEESFLLIKLSWGAGDNPTVNVKMWVNPLLDNEASLGTPDASTSRSNFIFNRIRLASGNPATAVMEWDEIRVGTTYDDVTSFNHISANTPSPVKGAEYVSISSDLQWNAGLIPDPADSSVEIRNPDIAYYYVYMQEAEIGAEPNAIGFTGPYTVADTGTDPVIILNADIPVTLQKEKRYYWRVDQGIDIGGQVTTPDDPNTITGPLWSFDCEYNSPVIQTQPQSVTVVADTTVELFIDGLNIASYQWYHSTDSIADPEYDTMLGTNAAENIVANVATEGWYYCIVSNGGEVSVTSTVVRVMTERLAGWWKLDGDFDDSIQEAIPGASVHNGSAVTRSFSTSGINGGAAEFFGPSAPDYVVTIVGSSDYFNFFTKGYTISVWTYMSDTSVWGGMLSKSPANNSAGYVLAHNNNGIPIHILRQFAPEDQSDGVVIDDNQWHMITGTYNPVTGDKKLFVDGMLLDTDNAPEPVYADASVMLLGRGGIDSGSFYEGLLDDARVYSYALSDIEVARLYTDADYAGGTICVESIRPTWDVSGPDGTQDCMVNVYDFVELAKEWLDCSLVPASACN